MMAHELCWTYNCWEDPCYCTADCQRLCPFNTLVTMTDPLLSACVLLPILLEVALLNVAIVVRTLRTWHVDKKAFMSLPCVVTLGCLHHGHLVFALGNKKRLKVLWRPVPIRDCLIGNDSWPG